MTDGNVVFANFETTLPLPPDRILQAAIDAKLDEVIIIGLSEKDEHYFAMSHTDCDRLLAQLEVARMRLLQGRMRRMGLSSEL